MGSIDLNEVIMELNWLRYSSEIADFLSADTLKEIDYGVLDLSNVVDFELRQVLGFLEELLTLELKVNYYENETGMFRVQFFEGKYCYTEFGHVIEADSICELKELVLNENRIWYVFDEILAQELTGRFHSD